MVSTDDPQQETTWRLRDEDSFARELQATFGTFPAQDRWIAQVVEAFSQRLQWHPREWTASPASPSDHSFRFFGVDIRYRVFPQDQTVEVISVSSILPHGRHPDATRTI